MWSPITKKFPKFSVDAIPEELRDMQEIPIKKLLNSLELVDVERFSERPKGVSMTLIIGVCVVVVSILIFFGVVAKWWIARKRGGKRSEGAQIIWSLLKDAVGTESVQRPNVSGLDSMMLSKGVEKLQVITTHPPGRPHAHHQQIESNFWVIFFLFSFVSFVFSVRL